MRYTLALQNPHQRKREDTQVERKALTLKVLSIESDFFVNRELIAPIDLSPSGYAGTQSVNPILRAEPN